MEGFLLGHIWTRHYYFSELLPRFLVTPWHSHVCIAVEAGVNKRVGDIVLFNSRPYFAAMAMSIRNDRLARVVALCVVRRNMPLLIPAHHQTCLAFFELVVLVTLVCVHPHAI